jgi:hypothetical protein
MNLQKVLTVAAIAVFFALVGFNRPGAAQDDIDELHEVDVQVSADVDLQLDGQVNAHVEQSMAAARRELELKQQALQLEMAEISRRAEQEGERGDARQVELARRQLELQMQQIDNQRQRYGMEHAGMGTGRQQGRPLRDQIRDAARTLRQADAASRAKIVDNLEAWLNQFFDQDMKRRAGELKKIEERFAKLRAQLDRRREKKQEIVDLQMKLILNEADGLGFYNGQGPFGEAPFGFDPFSHDGAHADYYPAVRAPIYVHSEDDRRQHPVQPAAAAQPATYGLPAAAPQPAAVVRPQPLAPPVPAKRSESDGLFD